MLKVVSAMRIPLTMVIIAIAMLASPLAYGQARTSGKPSGPAVGGGDRSLIPSTQPAVAPPGGTLSDLAGGGDAVKIRAESSSSFTATMMQRVPRRRLC